MMSTGNPKNEDDLESTIVGSLDIYIVPHAESGHREINKGARHLMKFNGADWEALFSDVLHCPEPEPYTQGENIDEYDKRYKTKFQQAIPEYPMLGRIWDLYVDVTYTMDEIKQLREECLKIQSTSANPQALEGLRKLIFACDEALKVGQGLFLASD